jgi:hypothetical protein
MLNIVVALATESRPLIDRFGLSEERSAVGFRIFSSEWVRLIATGSGRVSGAAGVATLGALSWRAGEKDPGMSAWVNIGVAGHARHPVGQGVHAVSILEVATSRRWYPVQVLELPGTTETVCTVDTPETDYPESYVYDMEASAFYATALRYATGELIQVYKIISDNRDNGVDTVDKHVVRNLVIDHLPAIEAIATGLADLAAEVNARRPKPPELEHIVSRWHFTVAQQHQLRGLLNKWETLSGGEPLMDAALNRCPSAKSVLAEIDARLHAIYGEGAAAEP